jgi:hypothetical protein
MFRFETTLSHSFYDEEENLLFIKLKTQPEPTLELARTNFEQTHYYLGQKVVKVITDLRCLEFAYIPREVMDYMANSPYNQYQESVALIISGLGQKLIGNFYLSVVKPKVKTRIFNSPEGALEWQKISDPQTVAVMMKETP